MTMILKYLRLASAVPVLVATLALFVMMVMTFADVVLRSAFDAPIEAATELTRILMAVIVFSVLPIVSARNEHIAVDLADPLFGKTSARIRDAVLALICGAALWWPAGRVVVLAERARDYGDVTEYLHIPQFYIGWFVAILVYVTAAVLVARGLWLLAALIWPGLREDADA